MRSDPAALARFSANLRRRRERLGLTQERVALSSGIHMTEVSKLERGTHEPRLSTIVALARALEVPPGHLLRGIEWRDAA